MKVLSLFDGMACARIALKELGIIPQAYYASEIDKHAIKQTQLNFPDTVQLGDVTKWRDWDIDWSSIDLILAGSPCQGFSIAGKQLAFDDPRSKLFFVFIDVLNHCKLSNPNVKFLLENVNMKKAHMRIISEYCGVFPVNINSNLVSAQNRDRWYWTNIRTKQVGLFGETYVDIPQPEDRKIFLKDVLDSEVDERYYVSQAVINRMNNSGQMSFISIDGKDPTQRSGGQGSLDKKHNYQFIKVNVEGKVSSNQDKSSCFTAGAHSGGNHSDMDLICVAMRGREDGLQHFEPQNTGKTNCLTSVQKDNLILQRSRGYNKGGFFEDKTPTLSSCAWEQNNLLCTKEVIQINPSKVSGGVQPYQQDRIRRLTPTECSRLQTIPAWYKWGSSDSAIYKMLGNGWTVEVIKHILSYLINNNKERK